MRSIAKEQRWWKTRTGFWTRQSRWLDGVLAVAVGPVAPAFAERTRRVECPRSIAEYAERYISPQSQQASELVAQEARELVGRVEMLLELLDAAQSRNQEGAQREIALAAAISERCGRGAAVLAAPALTPAVPRSLRLQRGGGGLCSRRAVAGAGARVQGAPGRSREAAAAGGRRRHRGRGGWTGLAPLPPHTDFPLPPHRTAPCASGTPRNPPGLAARAGDGRARASCSNRGAAVPPGRQRCLPPTTAALDKPAASTGVQQRDAAAVPCAKPHDAGGKCPWAWRAHFGADVGRRVPRRGVGAARRRRSRHQGHLGPRRSGAGRLDERAPGARAGPQQRARGRSHAPQARGGDGGGGGSGAGDGDGLRGRHYLGRRHEWKGSRSVASISRCSSGRMCSGGLRASAPGWRGGRRLRRTRL